MESNSWNASMTKEELWRDPITTAVLYVKDALITLAWTGDSLTKGTTVFALLHNHNTGLLELKPLARHAEYLPQLVEDQDNRLSKAFEAGLFDTDDNTLVSVLATYSVQSSITAINSDTEEEVAEHTGSIYVGLLAFNSCTLVTFVIHAPTGKIYVRYSPETIAMEDDLIGFETYLETRMEGVTTDASAFPEFLGRILEWSIKEGAE